jgi:hypothetical protein
VSGTDNRDIAIQLLADGIILGGMTYRLDPSLKEPPARADGRACRDRAGDLLRCLGVPADKVRDVHVTKVSFEVCMGDRCEC